MLMDIDSHNLKTHRQTAWLVQASTLFPQNTIEEKNPFFLFKTKYREIIQLERNYNKKMEKIIDCPLAHQNGLSIFTYLTFSNLQISGR